MDQPISARDQSIVTRALARESFAAIGKSMNPAISRERVRQIFNDYATEAQKLQLAAPVPVNGKVEIDDLPKGEPRHRIHVLLTGKCPFTAKQVRAGVRRWLAGELRECPTDSPVSGRMDLYVADSMRTRLMAECDRRKIDVSAAIRWIIAALEKETENAQAHSQE